MTKSTDKSTKRITKKKFLKILRKKSKPRPPRTQPSNKLSKVIMATKVVLRKSNKDNDKVSMLRDGSVNLDEGTILLGKRYKVKSAFAKLEKDGEIGEVMQLELIVEDDNDESDISCEEVSEEKIKELSKDMRREKEKPGVEKSGSGVGRVVEKDSSRNEMLGSGDRVVNSEKKVDIY